jgi:hypothetical protein
MNYVITCQLPINKLDEKGNWLIENGEPVYQLDENGKMIYEENFFCGFQPIPAPTITGLSAIEWDNDIRYALLFESRSKAKQVVKKIETGEPISIREVISQEAKLFIHSQSK